MSLPLYLSTLYLVWWWVAGGEGQFWEEELVYSRVYLGEQEEEEEEVEKGRPVNVRLISGLEWVGQDTERLIMAGIRQLSSLLLVVVTTDLMTTTPLSVCLHQHAGSVYKQQLFMFHHHRLAPA